MHYHIILTEKCNLQCKYCYGKSMEEFDNGLQDKFNYDLETPIDSQVKAEQLKSFLKSEDTLIFYGGEPLTKADQIKEIIDKIKIKAFRIQTNGLLIKTLPIKYWNKITKILISIDGTEERTDTNRGKGIHKKVLENMAWLRENNYKGEIVARMTLSQPDIYDQVLYLLETKLFNSIHWQLDAEFYKFDYNKEQFTKFKDEYNIQITKLLDYWVEQIQKGKVIKLYPFLGIFDTIYHNKTSLLPCGSGHANFTINTKGDLSACPIINSAKNFYCGSLKEGITKNIHADGWCKNCDYLKICGGRCLYSNKAQLWPKEGHDMVCQTIIHLIKGIQKRIPRIQEAISQNKVSTKDFNYEKYFGPEIIP
ncbi:TIGR04084 family radical SAM/SPASM domain-containing protein [Candidatus Pacearchaeota archaeon]|nr:TIGR04084 family radical SAM/SPASM domain-containing protein [Candidatus Pacearchaeota archaeon]